MRVLGIDPGATTGWCLYDTDTRSAVCSGTFRGHQVAELPPDVLSATVAVERPKGYGPTRPQLVDCGYVCGRLVERLHLLMDLEVHELTRLEVCQALSDAMHGVMRVRNDATAWAALLEMHGGPLAAKRGGPLYGVKAHGRAALAVAVAHVLLQSKSAVV